MGEARRAKVSRRQSRRQDRGGASPGAQQADAAPIRARDTWPLALVLAAAAVFRLAYLVQYRARSVFFDTPFFDALTYDRWARRIAAGELVSAEPFYFAPGYPYALAAVYAIVGASPLVVYALQLGLGLLNIVLVHRIAVAAFGHRAGIWAVLLAALYAPFPFLETKLMSATLALSLLLLALLALQRARGEGGSRRWLVAGALLGATSLVRPETLLFGPFVLVWIARWGPSSARARALAATILVAGWVVAIAPATIHNMRAGGGLTLISSQGGVTFFQANNPRANGLYVPLLEEGFSGHPRLQAIEEQELAERALGRPLSRSEVTAYWFGRGLTFIRDDPGRFLWLLGAKLVRFLGSYEYSTEYNLQVEREDVWLLRLPFVPFALLFALAVPAVGRGLGPGGWLLLFAALANLIAVLLFYVSSRYRLPSVPPLIVLGGATLTLLADALRARRLRVVWGTVAVVTVVFLLAHFEKDDASAVQEASNHVNVATAWVKNGAHERAVEEYRRALALREARPDTWQSLGRSLRALGRRDEAAAAFAEAARQRPTFFEAHALEGLMHEELGDWERARSAYVRAERLRPDDFEIHLRLGRVLGRLGDRAAGIQHLDRALALRPGEEAARQERQTLLDSAP
jgi:tetratricopeptide (TPR) repeat protein